MPNRDWARAEYRDRVAQSSAQWAEAKRKPVSDSDAYARRSAARQAGMKAAALRRDALRRP